MSGYASFAQVNAPATARLPEDPPDNGEAQLDSSDDHLPPAHNREREIFASMAAHELREPIHAIQSFLSVILRERIGPINAVQRDFLTSAYLAGRRLERLINDVQLMISRDQAFDIRPEPVDLLSHVNSACRELAPIAEGYHVSLAVDPRVQGQWELRADPTRLDQMLLNLIENAVRYAAAGSTVHVRLRSSASRVLCTIENVVDQPPPEDPREWFTPFHRGERPNAPERGGLGLGLAVVAHLVDAHGGYMFTRARETLVTIGFVLPRHEQPASGALLTT
jgi:signal transduction histidine kinase